ncbi:MAG: SGNH/GDSL hydrolase family protein [Clostridia bacterium]|nr:SGNH/GDSL hydrolase family protein [Clostridia bacterium]
MKKSISILVSLILFFSLMLPAFAEAPLNYLLLGDSITEGFGIKNPDEACYGRIVADTNGYNYMNIASVATDSSDLLMRLENYYTYQNAIAWADVISLSIGANDYLANPDAVSLTVGALFKLNYKKLDKIADGFYDNLCVIIDRITEINPDAVILLQKVYSVWYGFAANAFDAAASRCNGVIEKYAAEHPGKVVICDITPAMNGIHENLADDCVHPNAAGNMAIARIVLAQLKDLGLGTATEPVVNAQGVDYNFYTEQFGPVAGKVIEFLVKTLTGNGVNLNR